MPTDWRQEPVDTERRRLPSMSQSDLRPPDPGPAERSSRYNHILHAVPTLAGSSEDRNPASAARGYKKNIRSIAGYISTARVCVCVCVCVCVWDLLGVGLRIALLRVGVLTIGLVIGGVALVITTISLIIPDITPLIVATIVLFLHINQLKSGEMIGL